MFKWINPFPQNAFPSILNDLRQISLKMRRSRKLSWKKGGVDCEVSRRGRDFPRITRICPQSRCNYGSYREDTFFLTRTISPPPVHPLKQSGWQSNQRLYSQ